MSAHFKNTLSLVAALVGLGLLVLVTATSCGGSAASAAPPHYDPPSADPGGMAAGDPASAPVEPPAGDPAPPDPAPDPAAGGPALEAPADEPVPVAESYGPLDAIPTAFQGYPEPYSGYLAASQELDGVVIPGGSATRLWLDDASGHVAFAYYMDWQSAAEATARLAELRPHNASEYPLGDGGWEAEDASSAGYPGFRAVAFRRGSDLILVAAGISDPRAVAAPMAALEELAAGILDFMSAHELAMPEGLADAGLAATSLKLSVAAGKQVSESRTASVPLDLMKGGKKAGSITFKLIITMTEEQCNGGVVFIVDVYISEISLGDDDGDGFGKGMGDIMVGGDISVSFNAGGKVTSGKAGPFATTEIGDIDANSTAKEGDKGTELPRFIGSVKGCGIPEKVDFDILVRDSDEGTDVKDIVGAGGAAAAEYLAGSETAKRVGEAIDKAGEKAEDKSGTEGMKELRERAGDDIGEAHDKQESIDAK